MKQILVTYDYIVLFSNDSACYSYKNQSHSKANVKNTLGLGMFTVYKYKNKYIQITNSFLFTFFLKFVPQGMIIGAVRRLSSPTERTLFVSTLLY